MTLPFDGAISQYFENDAPKDIRKAIKTGHKDDILNPTYPYDEEIAKQDYKDTYEALQIELVKLQAWVKSSGQRIAIVFEGRDAAGKGGTIKRFRENLNPRGRQTAPDVPGGRTPEQTAPRQYQTPAG